jgi:hypothetical protein
MTISNGWYNPLKKDCNNLLCKDLYLLLLGVLCPNTFLATGVASHLYVIIQTEISREVHRKIFLYWTAKFAEKKSD